MEKLIIFWQEQTVLEMTIGYKAQDREFVSLKKSWVFRNKQWQPTIRTNKITTICLTQHQDRHRVRVRVPALAPVAVASSVWTAWFVQEEAAILIICQLIIWKHACTTNDPYQLYRHRHKCTPKTKLNQLMPQVLVLVVIVALCIRAHTIKSIPISIVCIAFLFYLYREKKKQIFSIWDNQIKYSFHFDFMKKKKIVLVLFYCFFFYHFCFSEEKNSLSFVIYIRDIPAKFIHKSIRRVIYIMCGGWLKSFKPENNRKWMFDL